MENLAHKLHDLHQKATDKNFPAGVLLARQMNKNSCNFHACQKEHTACYCLEQTLHPLQHDLAREQSVCTVAILLFTHTHTHPPNKTTKKRTSNFPPPSYNSDTRFGSALLSIHHTIKAAWTTSQTAPAPLSQKVSLFMVASCSPAPAVKALSFWHRRPAALSSGTDNTDSSTQGVSVSLWG